MVGISSQLTLAGRAVRSLHELSITQSLLQTSIREARQQKAVKIRTIRLLLGTFSGIEPQCIQMYLDLLAEGTIAEGARVEATVLPLKVRCRDCGLESEITRSHIACPSCGGLRLQILSGSEFMIDSLEVDMEVDVDVDES